MLYFMKYFYKIYELYLIYNYMYITTILYNILYYQNNYNNYKVSFYII
jgi:hypothetical protein